MARYQRGINGSFDGSAGGVTVYTRCGVQILSKKKTPPLTFKAARGQEIVIANFAELSKLMRPFKHAFRYCIPAPYKMGQTSYSIGCAINYNIQRERHTDERGIIHFDKSDVIFALPSLPSFVPILQHVRSDVYALIWTPPPFPDLLQMGQVTIMYLSNEGEYTLTNRDIAVGRVEFAVNFLMRSPSDYLHVYFCPHSSHGVGTTEHYIINPAAEVGEPSA